MRHRARQALTASLPRSAGATLALVAFALHSSAQVQVRQVAYLKASNTSAADHFGCGGVLQGHTGQGVAISADGTTLAVGSPHKDDSGAVYVFVRAGERWTEQAYLQASNPQTGAAFGHYVALSADGNTLAVAAVWEASNAKGINGNQKDESIPQAGAVYVFTRRGAAWTQQAYIKPSNGETQDSFGVHVALSGDGATLLVGSLDEDCKATGVNAAGCDTDWNDDLSMGAAYVFARGAGGWTQQAFLKPSNTGPNDWFGSRLALSGDGNTAAIGAALEDSGAKGINGRQDDESAGEAGVVYLFRRTGTAWRQQAYIKGSNTEAFDEFGSSVALDRAGTILVSSARGEDSGARGVNGNQADNSAADAGAVYVFSVSGS